MDGVKGLTKSRDNRQIAGGNGLLLYIILALFMPEASETGYVTVKRKNDEV